MTDRLEPDIGASTPTTARSRGTEHRVLLATGLKLALASVMFVAVAVPDKEIAAKAFKLNMIVKNMRQRVGH